MITPIRVPMRVSSTRVQIPMGVSANNVQVRMSLSAAYNIISGDWYDGETEVESLLFHPYQLETKDKLMPENVTVLPITILDVDNPAGGYTVTIGKY